MKQNKTITDTQAEGNQGAPRKADVLALIKRLRQKPSTYNRELLDEAADTLEALQEEREILREIAVCCDSCKHGHVPLHDEPCHTCFGHNKWEAE